MACLPRPVMIRIWSQPEAMASSTPYWMVGLSTSGSISFGCALVTGRKRVPRPAAGKMALRTIDAVTTTIYMVDTLEGIRPGLEGRLERVVDSDLLTRHVGGKGTFSTPAMIGLMEITCHRSIERMLPEGHTSVGYEVHVRHLAPTAPGRTVVVTSRVAQV